MDKTALQIRRFLKFLKLDAELEEHTIVQESIEKGIVFKGTNLWILVFAIVIASVGLNMNSTAVIIGAMLISPLMGPINGIGYSIATYNIDLLKRSLKNFGFAVGASIIASFLYFLITPVSTAHSELLARTSPTIYDVIIALFGGFSGIVAICSKQKGNVIPGVAIATALMPPLCTVGFGLAKGESSYFMGAFYLFTINTVFIALSSMIVARILKFPAHPFITERFKKMTKLALWMIIVVTVVPSLYFGYTLVQKEKFVENANNFINNVGIVKDNYLLKNETNPDQRTIKLIYAGNTLSDDDKKGIVLKANDFNLKDCKIVVEQGLNMDNYKSEKIAAQSEVEQLKSEIGRMKLVLGSKDSKIDSLEAIGDFGKIVLNEIQILYPTISSASFAKTRLYKKDTTFNMTFCRIESKHEFISDDQDKIYKWLKQRTEVDSLFIDFEVNHN